MMNIFCATFDHFLKFYLVICLGPSHLVVSKSLSQMYVKVQLLWNSVTMYWSLGKYFNIMEVLKIKLPKLQIGQA